MRCVRCEDEETVDSETTVAFGKNGVAFLFRHVPAMVCPECGEEYLSEKIQDRLTDITNRCLQPEQSINIYDFKSQQVKA